MLTLATPETIPTPTLPTTSMVRLIRVAPERWRVLDRFGRAVGHIDAAGTPDGVRYSARRYHSPSRTYRDLGTFWSPYEATECLRLSR